VIFDGGIAPEDAPLHFYFRQIVNKLLVAHSG